MKMFDVYYSGVVSIEAETEEEARDDFYRQYWDYGDIDEVEDVTEEWALIGKNKYLTEKK